MYKIGILGFKNDDHVKTLLQEIKRKKAQPVLIDFYNFPRFNLLTLGDETVYDDIHIKEEINLKDISILFIRNINRPLSDKYLSIKKLKSDSLHATRRLMYQYSFIKIMKNKIPVINMLYASCFHRLKAYQHYLLNSQGIRVPKTLATNNLKAIHEFAAKYHSRIIAKPNTSGAEVVMVDHAFLKKNKHIILSRPFLFQQYVKGKSFRAYVLGGKIISFGSIHYNENIVDWREKQGTVVKEMPQTNLKKQINKAVKILNLAFCSVDIEYDYDTKTYYFLDFSPNPLFLYWSKMTGDAIAVSIIDYLIKVIDNKGQIWQDE